MESPGKKRDPFQKCQGGKNPGKSFCSNSILDSPVTICCITDKKRCSASVTKPLSLRPLCKEQPVECDACASSIKAWSLHLYLMSNVHRKLSSHRWALSAWTSAAPGTAPSWRRSWPPPHPGRHHDGVRHSTSVPRRPCLLSGSPVRLSQRFGA